IAIVIHGINTFGPSRYFDDSWEERHVRKTLARQQAREEPRTTPDERASDAADEMQQVSDRGAQLVDTMRASARRVPDPDVRREALNASAAADQALAAIRDHPDELPLARDFIDRFLTPASAVMNDYSRLANRDVPS